MKGASSHDPLNTIRFTARMEAGGVLPLPNGVSAEIAASSTPVEGTIEGFPFRAAAEPNGSGHVLKLTPAQAKAAGLADGDEATVEVTRIDDTPEVRVPTDLLEALAASPKAQELWHDITPMARREWVRWIASAKQAETRVWRIEVGIDKLLSGMRRPCCFPGLNWVTKDHVSAEETWAQLPGAKGSAKKAG